jgi:hypothetical protein
MKMSNVKSESKNYNPLYLEEVTYPSYDQTLLGSHLMPEGGEYELLGVGFLRHMFHTCNVVVDNELLACYEGVYEWDHAVNDYVWVGQISKVVRKREVRIIKNTSITYQNEIIHLKCGEVYKLRREHITYHDDSDPEIVFEIQREGSAPFEVADNNDILYKSKQDFVMISRVAEPVIQEESIELDCPF